MIVAIVNSAGDKVLLGRKRHWPEHFFSCLAGFLEPGESIEDAVRREAWEESGVRVGRVVVHSSQPWPYPASLMIGCVGQTESAHGAEEIHLGHDIELHQAAWYPIAFVRDMLARPATSMDGGPPKGFKEVLPPSPLVPLPFFLFCFVRLGGEGWLMVSTGGYSPATRDRDCIPAAARCVQ